MDSQEDRKQINKLLAKPLALTAGIIGLIQGLAWTIFSVLCICCYYKTIQVDTGTGEFNVTEYYKVIYTLFLDNDIGNPLAEIIVKPNEFFIFMWFYAVFSAIWAVTSGTIIWAMIHDQWHISKSLFGLWSATTIIVSIVDVVLTSLLIADYVTSNYAPTNVLTCYGIVLSLSARGFILWIVNVVFAAIMTKYTVNLILKENKESTVPIIHGFESNGANPPWFNNEVKDFWSSNPTTPATSPRSNNIYTNPPFDRQGHSAYASTPTTPATSPRSNIYANSQVNNNAYDNHGFERSQSFYTPENIYVNPINTNKNQTPANNKPSSFSEAIRTATIGKNKGRRSPPNYVEPPIIPTPDYTPPNSPNLKSVLRSTSNYNR